MRQKLDRSLGMFSAITISVGTMVGSAIFVLAGTSYEAAGPSASLSIFLAGIAAIFTAFSFAELVTIIPKAGGGYAYVREATNNNVIGFICGWGFWLGYAMSCGLFAIGFGNFLNYFFPFIPEMIGTYILIVYVIGINIKGMKNSGGLQNIITVGLIVLLMGYIIYGFFHIDLTKQTPFFTEGLGGMFHAMGFLYMTYIGYGLVTTASEEVINPQKTIPRAIIISLVFVIFLKTAAFFIGSGLIHWQQLIPAVTGTPLTDTAVVMGGVIGGYLFALAGIFATVSSINTAIIASSRTSFALARDQRFPSIFKVINNKTKTPIFSIITAGIIVIISVSIRDLEHISAITSIFSLTGYSLVNVALIIFRKKEPDLKRSFKAPLYPLSPVLGIGLNIFLVVQLGITDTFALLVSIGVIALGLLYYYFGIPRLKSAPKGISPLEIPIVPIQNKINAVNANNNGTKSKIYVPVANPNTLDSLINFANSIAKAEDNTNLIPLHVANVPESIPLDSGYYGDLKETITEWKDILGRLQDYEEKFGSYIKPVVVFSRDITHGITSSIEKHESSMLLIGWHAHDFKYDITGGIVTRMFEEAPTDVCVFKDNGLKEVKNILFPYGGGRYSQTTAAVVKRIADALDAKVTVVKVVDHIESISEEMEYKEQIQSAMENLTSEFEVEVRVGDLVQEVVALTGKYDLMILGASLDWGLKDYITGIRSDEMVENADCSVLAVKSFHNTLQRKSIRSYVKKAKDFINKG
ncbi:amino acid permease [Natranaerofaba carboxydovora]|uniref:amino acid permease n=1 Tax=Natranaerofaba carboxydovora TaxID=2742683 RepID=UPI001F128CF8|nr:amino acid permease [Natranaerofaba carboxydovora]UMZ74208.1 putative amino acid permease YhdG [Natranaerofaba carboxydovora]